MKNICLLGATGSIGESTIDIIRANPNEYTLSAFSFNQNINKAREIINEFKPSLVASPVEENIDILKKEYPDIEYSCNINDVAVYKCHNPYVINAVVGSAGLVPTITAIDAKRNVLLANKETLVMAGKLVMDMAKKNNVKIIPIDSEHSAIFQLIGFNNKEINKIIITASGGALYNKTIEELKNVTVEEALKHPRCGRVSPRPKLKGVFAMRAVLTRVNSASVTIDGEVVGKIGKGFLILLGVGPEDTEKECRYLAEKALGLRVFEDENGKMNLGLDSVNGEVLVVSQFTLYGNVRKGRRPSFAEAADPELGNQLYEKFLSICEELGYPPQHGRFGADMQVESVNDGPVTLILDTVQLMETPRRG